ncbi:hypothetical protein CSPHI_08860 [Corynebacterium sphenisci DSM 44792]|uniref:DUF262 domain-containing protein n=1 Tax=Corynebacterium sphenisci DSM 44792 TaxID=1437874 RepID=A0A1L7CZ48_9CORY|nr:DUF262 domain-containing protein [Corynebacterium sphenisci]APT91110.1 hypothetical protein CSPHI_08860 [Corynebacterium sphenisci DSM 44792]
MIKSANQYHVHALFSHEGNILYKIPPYQREYSWSKSHWEDLFEDLVDAEGQHFLGTIITLDQTDDALQGSTLEVIDGQQRLTTLTLLLAAVYAVLKEHLDELDEDTRTDVNNLSRQLVRRSDGQPRVVPQMQGHNLSDFLKVLEEAGLPVKGEWKPYYPSRKIKKCYKYFRQAIRDLGETGEGLDETSAALRVHKAALQAVIVKIEVGSHADAFVLFESLNNRGMPLSPVDLIKNHLLAVSEKKEVMEVSEAFGRWNEMLTNLGDSYSTHERFLRHYYNAFKPDLPDVPGASIATKSNLIRVYEKVLEPDVLKVVDSLVSASQVYGRINCVAEVDQPTTLDRAFQRLMRAQGATSYVLLLWLMTMRDELALSDAHLEEIVDLLTSFFVRRNLTGAPPTYVLAKLFMTIIGSLRGVRGHAVVERVREKLTAVSASDDEFRNRLSGPIYDENTDIARFVLATLAEDAMTKETWVDLWRQEKNRFVWTIEHILPQGENLPAAWREMLGGAERAAQVQEEHRHRLGNLTITAYNSSLGNKSFAEKRDRQDRQGRYIGYRNGLSLNVDLAARDSWTGDDIARRTEDLAARVLARFPLPN